MLRGVLLERIVYVAVSKRKQRTSDIVMLNVKRLKRPGTNDVPVNKYSVDVAACLPSNNTVELYACKLQSYYMPLEDLQNLDELGEYFSQDPNSRSITAVCCLETEASIDPDFADNRARYDWIYLVTVETLADLQSADPGSVPSEDSDSDEP